MYWNFPQANDQHQIVTKNSIKFIVSLHEYIQTTKPLNPNPQPLPRLCWKVIDIRYYQMAFSKKIVVISM